ncbi:hypothetical protein FBALC1_15667 [Flavobacteriales bacterium ALC-1]|nr:hypothetical protein FBALC1_15667 [Flavobacteriales bacterium ALC-1]
MDKEELIAQYLTKKLSQEAQKEFDHLMVTDPQFKKEVTFQEDLRTVIQKEENEIIKSQLQDFETEEHSNFSFKNWFVAASVAILLGLSGAWYFNNSIDTEKLYTENFKPYRNIVQPIVRGETKTDLKTKAFTAYETKNYTKALKLFDQILKVNTDETIAFYKANVLLELDKTNDAISIFEKNLKTPDSLDDKNNWYLALAYLKLNNIKKTKAILGKLKTTSTYRNKNVKQLLKKLD